MSHNHQGASAQTVSRDEYRRHHTLPYWHCQPP